MAILIIDDEEWNISKLEEKLREEGATIEYASTLDNLFEYLLIEPERYEAIITDYNIDRLDGKRLISILRGRFGDLEVKIDTSFEEIEEVDQEIASVLKDYFETPQEYNRLLQTTRNLTYVLFSSASYGNNLEDLEGVFIELKNNNDPKDYRAETNITNHLKEKDIIN
ncbi:response regulator [Candidatus Woesearchaeota archaeon]|nr:response regulator [Candidatus Woesearchaeota archaeon]